MKIELVMEARDPPAGLVASAEDGDPVRFVGWLGLLRVLSEAFETTETERR